MDKETFNKIYEEHKKKLINIEAENLTKVAIHFSGVSGSGKSRLSKILAERYQAIVINNDSIRDILRDEFDIESDSNPIKNQQMKDEYLKLFYNHLIEFPNKFIVFDSSCDRTYDRKAKYFGDNEYTNFIIRLDIPREEIERRIKVDKGDGAQNYLENLDRWFEDNRRFNESHKVDFVYKGDDDLDDLFEAIAKRFQ